jgi:DNA polymerase-4
MTKLIKDFGSFGAKLYELARGIDNRPIEPHRIRKSLSVEHTFNTDLQTLEACIPKISELYHELKSRLQSIKSKVIAKQFIKIKFGDFTVATKESLSTTIGLSNYLELFKQCYAQHNKAVRLIGIGARFKPKSSSVPASLNLF